MVISSEEELAKLKEIGRICGFAMQTMADAMEPGMTTLEMDAIGRKVLEDNGAQSAPESVISFRVRPASASTKKWHTAFPAPASSRRAISSILTCQR